MNNQTPTVLNTPEARMSYMSLLQTSPDLNGFEKYSVTLLFPKNTNLDDIKTAIRQVIQDETDKKFKGVPQQDLQICLKDGDAYYAKKPEKREAYRGMFYINTSKRPEHGTPTVLDENGLPVTDPSVFDSGDYGIARVNFWGYNNKGNTGVSCTVLGVKKTRTGERFGGGESSDTTTEALGGLATPPVEDDIFG